MSLSSSFAGRRSSSRLVRQTVCSLCTVAVLAILLTGCVHAPKPPIAAAPGPVGKVEERRRVPTPPPSPDAAAERDLIEGIDLYDQGDFNGAIKKLSGSAEIAADFARGNFEKPLATHAEIPPGVATMKQLAGRIRYSFKSTPRGGLVRILTDDAAARRAVHEFLRYQITEHATDKE